MRDSGLGFTHAEISYNIHKSLPAGRRVLRGVSARIQKRLEGRGHDIRCLSSYSGSPAI